MIERIKEFGIRNFGIRNVKFAQVVELVDTLL